MYSLKYPARALAAVSGGELGPRWMVGTTSLRELNELHLVEYDDDAGELHCVAVSTFKPGEILDLAPALGDAAPEDPENYAHVWVQSQGTGPDAGVVTQLIALPLNAPPATDDSDDMTVVTTLDTGSSSPTGVVSSDELVVTVADDGLIVFEHKAGSWTQSMSFPAPEETGLNAGVVAIDPHHDGRILAASGCVLLSYDVKSGDGKASPVALAGSRIRAVDYHPARPWEAAMVCEDGSLLLVNVRTGASEVKERVAISGFDWKTGVGERLPVPETDGKWLLSAWRAHRAWPACVAFNQVHDGMLLTGAADMVVDTWVVGGVSPGLVDSLEVDDSITALSWAAEDAWHWAALSYDGRVTVRTVPDKFKPARVEDE